jgi:Fe2+ or Zn2+ uptake regulation protein
MNLNEKKQVSLLTVYTLLNFMKSFPSLARKYC